MSYPARAWCAAGTSPTQISTSRSPTRPARRAPGWFDSPLATTWQQSPRLSEMVLGHTAQRRWGPPTDLPGAYLFLASEASAFVTGTVLTVDGGYLLV